MSYKYSMKSLFTLCVLVCAATAYAGPITLLSDSRFRHSKGSAEYQSTNAYLNGQQSMGWNMQADSPFGGMDGYDLNEIPLGYYNGGSGTMVKGMVGMTSGFEDGTIHGSGFTSNYIGIATSGPYAQSGDSGYGSLKMQSHYEISFCVDEAIYFDFSGLMLGACSLLLMSDNGFSLGGMDLFAYSGVLTQGVYTILGDACSTLELGSEGVVTDQKQFSFNFSYQAVPDEGSTALLLGVGVIGLMALARVRTRKT